MYARYIPRLVVNNLDIDIKTLELKFFDSKMSGIINLLSRLFKDTIRRRLTETLATQTASQLGRLVGRLNAFATKCVWHNLLHFRAHRVCVCVFNRLSFWLLQVHPNASSVLSH